MWQWQLANIDPHDFNCTFQQVEVELLHLRRCLIWRKSGVSPLQDAGLWGFIMLVPAAVSLNGSLASYKTRPKSMERLQVL